MSLAYLLIRQMIERRSSRYEPEPVETRPHFSLPSFFGMYLRYALAKGWEVDMVDQSETEGGGMREVIFQVNGEKAFADFKYESGVHRVQRVPVTEARGRVHTSTATVAVLPEATEVDVEIKPEDLRIDVFRSGGHGGQSVNTTDSAVRITHLPTGLVATCQDEKSQTKNKEKAMGVLRSRLYELEQQKLHSARASERKSQIGTCRLRIYENSIFTRIRLSSRLC